MSTQNRRLSRRAFVVQSSVAALSAALPLTLTAETGIQSLPKADTPIDLKAIDAQQEKIPNRDTLLKFNNDGSPKAFAGNTVICHLPVQCAMRDAMIGLHDELVASALRPKLGLTSVDSYHMTVFPGSNDLDRTIYGWPKYLSLNATMEECNRVVGERMRAAQLQCKLPLRVRLDLPDTLNYFSACTLRMVPATREDNAKLRSVRDQLAEIFGFRTKDHDQYTFHITMSYQLDKFTSEEQTKYRQILRENMRRIVEAEPVLELGEPEFCTFSDMFRFEPKTLLACS